MCETEQSLYDRSPRHLLGAHAAQPALSFYASFCTKILINEIIDSRVIFQDRVDGCQFLCLVVIGCGVHQRNLFLHLFEHFVADFFLEYVVIMDCCATPIYYMREEKSTAKFAFSFYSRQLFPWTGTKKFLGISNIKKGEQLRFGTLFAQKFGQSYKKFLV